MRNRIKMAEGSVQDVARSPAELRAIYRTVVGDPDASLIDMAADRGAYIDQSQSLNLFVEKPEHRRGFVDVHVCVEEGPEDDLLPAFAARDAHREDNRGSHWRRSERHRCGVVLARESRDLRGMPMSATERPEPSTRSRLLPDAASDEYPVFFEMYRTAIKNTWTVEEVDFSTDIGDLRGKMTAAERHLIQRLVAFFATGDSIVANNLVLNLVQAHQLAGSPDVPVAPAL